MQTYDTHSAPISDGNDDRCERISGTWLHGSGTSSNDTSSGASLISKLNLCAIPSGRRFDIEFVSSSFVEDEFELYKRYQMSVHGDTLSDCEERHYRRFLVDSPLIPRGTLEGRSGPRPGYGSFHVRYTLDGQLFAVGVVDVLPRCLSSVYLFFDPAFGTLSPGVLSALKEIEWVRQVAASVPELEYYYMGYYIHTCPKMKYKGDFKPSEILCDETKHWVLAETAQAVLDAAQGSTIRLAACDAPLTRAAADHAISNDELRGLVDQSLVLVDRRNVVSFRVVELALSDQHGADVLGNIRNNLSEFIRLVGRDQSQVFAHSLHW
jgi:arginyl-tRNA--protein-N-Asp/Glu arginylyltransferase